MICPDCNSDQTTRAIGAGMSVNLCIKCGAIWGFFSYIYVIFAMVESFFNDGYCELMGYEGSYLDALKIWIKGFDDDE